MRSRSETVARTRNVGSGCSPATRKRLVSMRKGLIGKGESCTTVDTPSGGEVGVSWRDGEHFQPAFSYESVWGQVAAAAESSGSGSVSVYVLICVILALFLIVYNKWEL